MQQSKDNMEHTRLRVESERGDTHRGRGSRPRLWTFTLTLMKQCLSCLISDWAAWWRKGLVFDQWPRHVQRSLPLICRANVISRYRSFATDNLKKTIIIQGHLRQSPLSCPLTERPRVSLIIVIAHISDKVTLPLKAFHEKWSISGHETLSISNKGAGKYWLSDGTDAKLQWWEVKIIIWNLPRNLNTVHLWTSEGKTSVLFDSDSASLFFWFTIFTVKLKITVLIHTYVFVRVGMVDDFISLYFCKNASSFVPLSVWDLDNCVLTNKKQMLLLLLSPPFDFSHSPVCMTDISEGQNI